MEGLSASVKRDVLSHAFLSASVGTGGDDLARSDNELAALEDAETTARIRQLEKFVASKVDLLQKAGVDLAEARTLARKGAPGLYEVLASFTREGGHPDQTVRQYRYAVKRFVELHGDLPVRGLRRDHLRDYAEVAAGLPVDHKLAFFNLPIVNCVRAREAAGAPHISRATLTKHISALKALLAYAANAGFVAEDPFAGYRSVRPRGGPKAVLPARAGFEPSELEVIWRFLRAQHTSHDDEFWVPHLALYLGARMEEICQLHVADIVEEGPNKIVCVRITDADAPDKRLKNHASVRTIPLHPALVDFGFLKHVARAQAAGEVRIFYSLPADQRGRFGGPYGKRFGRFLRKRVGISDERKAFHSFRHTWTRLARDAGIPQDVRERLAGRVSSGSEEGYGDGFGPDALLAWLRQVEPFGRDSSADQS